MAAGGLSGEGRHRASPAPADAGDGILGPAPHAIDWSRVWLSPYREDGRAVEAAWLGGLTVAESLNGGTPPSSAASAGMHGEAGITAAHAPPPAQSPLPRFVPPSSLPAGEAYEAFIHRTGCVPTRDNLHDFFNGLVWRRFPRVKRRLNELQAAEIAEQGVGPRRGALRDALTLFDENAALLQAPPVLADALRRRDWPALFTTHRALWDEATLTLFGHALMEKLARQPRKAVTAHVWLLPAAPSAAGPVDDAALEHRLLPTLAPQVLAAKPFLPLPVLGVPGWWPGNETPGFYDDPSVFRPLPPAGR